MKSEREFFYWITVAMLLLSELIAIVLLFFVALNLKTMTKDITININYPERYATVWGDPNE